MTQSTAWLLLVASGVLDVLWAISVKYAAGYTRPGWSLLSVLLLAAFIVLLGQSLRVLPVGTATRSGPASAPSARSRSGWRCSANRPIRCASRASRWS